MAYRKSTKSTVFRKASNFNTSEKNSSKSISSKFDLELCGGYGSSINPQFSFSSSMDGQCSIKVNVKPKTTCGLIFWVNECKSKSRLLSLTSTENPEVSRSAYMITNSCMYKFLFLFINL